MHRGTQRYVADFKSEVLHKLVGVTTSTEGGCFDSENGYDRAVLSLGLVQITPIAGLGTLLSRIMEQVPSEALKEVSSWQTRYGVDLLEALKLGSSPELALQLYGCHGREGSWNGASWDRAEALFQALAGLLVHPVARQIQLDFTASKILSWVMPETRKILFQDLHTEGWTGALQAAVVSFSANLPAVADKHFRAYVEEKGGFSESEVDQAYVLGAIDAMTYRPKISIYPHRKEAILPAIERIYDVRFPGAFSVSGADPQALSPKGAQQILLKLGYDLGPAGADGVFGLKSVAALTEYQRMRGLDPDGVLGPITRAELAKEGVPKELPRDRSHPHRNTPTLPEHPWLLGLPDQAEPRVEDPHQPRQPQAGRGVGGSASPRPHAQPGPQHQDHPEHRRLPPEARGRHPPTGRSALQSCEGPGIRRG